jgi:hypothetical protein
MLDDQVRRAMRKWPQVPAVYGWLRLSRRGQWFLVDRGQADFDEARHGHGSAITSPPILDFIGRNYEADEQGAWYWQNGPQRAYVALELAPLVLRVLGESPAPRLVTHTGWLVERVTRVACDLDGNLFLQTDLGPAVVDDRDIGQLDLRESGGEGQLTLLLPRHAPPGHPDGPWPVEPLGVRGAGALGRALGYMATPAAAPASLASPAAPGRPDP